MKQSKVSVTAISNMTGAKVMGFDPHGTAHILSILNNMYSDPGLAVVREYAANARDSHVEAGNTDPILITSPSYLNPILVVQDFGTGLSPDEVENVFAVYGTSTKRGVEGQIGYFGIGSKSAFTIGSQFTVTAVKDGVMSVALFALDNDGNPTVNIVSETGTDEPDGVKVEVAVSDVDNVTNAIERLFATWPQGSVLVDGVEPTSIWDDVEELAEGVHLGWRPAAHTSDGFVVIMGGVAYSLPTSVVETLDYRQKTIVNNVRASYAKVYLTVPLGAVDLTPSREDLRVTPMTTATLNDMVDRFHNALTPWITKQISDAPTLIAAIIAADDLRRKLPNRMLSAGQGPTWHGKPLPSSTVKIPAEWFHLARRGYSSPMNARRERTDFELVASHTMRQALFVTGVPERRVRTVQLAAKEYMLAHKDKDDPEYTNRVVALTQPDAAYAREWFTLSDPLIRTMDYDTFAKFRPLRAPGSHRAEIKYEVHGSNLRQAMTVPEINAHTGNIYYLTHYERPNYTPGSPFVAHVVGNGLLIVLSSTQKVEPLLKRVPRAASLVVQARAEADRILNSVTPADLDALDAASFLRSIDQGVWNFLAANETDITHQAVLDALDMFTRARVLERGDQSRVGLIQAALRITQRNASTLGTSTLNRASIDVVLNGLPLLSRYFDRDWLRSPLGNQHVIAYVNMVGQSATD